MCVMRFIRASVNVLITAVGVMLFCLSLMTVTAATTTDVAVASTGSGMFNPSARLDTSTIDDLRAYRLTDPAEAIMLPEGYAIETTPMVPVPGTRYVVPEESPDGGHVLPVTAWSEGSPVYSDGWTLRITLEPFTVAWQAQAETIRPVAQVTTTAGSVELSPRCVRAARDILHASLSRHLRVEEDLSYRGAPRRVGQCNDLLAEAYFTDGRQMVNGRHDHQALRTFLRTVIRTGELPAVSSSVRV